MQKITPFLWFEKDAEEAANFYVEVFSKYKESKITNVSRYDENSAKVSGQKEGSAMVVAFTLGDQEFNAINGGPVFTFNEAISFVINCDNQEEVDYFWEKLSYVPESEQCGWLKDKFGVSWQVVPKQLGELMSDPDPKKAEATMKEMLRMKKIVISELEQAADQA